MLSIRGIAGIFVVTLVVSQSVANKGCKVHSDCEQDEGCIHNKCGYLGVNCYFTETCGVNATCEVRNHKIHCICKPGHRGTQYSPCEEPVIGCVKHSDCPSNLICVSPGKCDDPCVFATCGPYQICVTTHHIMSCECLQGYRLDPQNKDSECKECHSHNDCPEDSFCLTDRCQNTCEFNPCGSNTTCNIKDRHMFCECIPGHIKINPTDFLSACKKPECTNSSTCGIDTYCKEGKCVTDPCKNKCGPNTECIVTSNHGAICRCKPEYCGNPDDTVHGCQPRSYQHNMTTYEVDLYNLKSQQEAMMFCLTKGSRLVSITNPKKQLEVEKYLTENVPPGNTFWIWTSGVYTSKVVMWPTSSTVSNYTNFSESAYMGASCVNLKQESHYQWGTYDCTIKQAFLCEKSVKV